MQLIRSTGEALDIYDILKLTHNGVLEEKPRAEDTTDNPEKGGVLQSSKWTWLKRYVEILKLYKGKHPWQSY